MSNRPELKLFISDAMSISLMSSLSKSPNPKELFATIYTNMVREANDGFIGSSLSHEQNNKEINIVKVNKNRVMNFIFDNFMQKYKKNRNPQSYVFSK